MAMAQPVRPPVTGMTRTRRVVAVPHRFFFLIGVTNLGVIALWWAWTLAARAWPAMPALPSAVPDMSMHALAMLYGFAPFFMFGFLFTAGPRWLGVDPPPPSAWQLPGMIAAAGALLLIPAQIFGAASGAIAVRIAAGAYAVGWLWLASRFGMLLRASAAADKVHATLVFAALLAGVSGVAAFAWLGVAAHPWLKSVGLWGFLLPVFVTVCHRMIPFFTASVMPFVTAFRPGWLLTAMVAAPIAHGVLEGAGLGAWTWAIDAPFGVLMLWITLRWGMLQSMKFHLLAMLHLGFLWYGIGFILAGAHSLALAAGVQGIALAPLHALTIGFASSLLMAMVTRVTCGHSGYTLAADTLTWRLFLLLQVTATVRVAAEVAAEPWWLALAAAMFAASFVPWCVRYAPVYWQLRADGRPG